jgi:hypothetical protein
VIVHVVLFQPRPGLSDERRDRVLSDLRRAATEIPSIRRFRIGQRILHGLPGYEQAMRDNYEYVAIIEFDDRDGLGAYLRHPAHEAAGAHFTTSAERALAYDFDVTDVI